MARAKAPENETPAEAATRRVRDAAMRWDEQTRRFAATIRSNTTHLTKKQKTELTSWMGDRLDTLDGAVRGSIQAGIFSDNGSNEE